MTNTLTSELFFVIATPNNAGHWATWGRVELSGTQEVCQAHLDDWNKADEAAIQDGNLAASCDSRFMISKSDFDAEFAND